MVIAVSACGDNTSAETTTTESSGATTTAAGGGETTTTAATSEPVTIRLWVNREQYLPPQSFYDALAASHPNITVEAELVPDDDLFFQLIRMNESGEQMPDVVQLDDYFAVLMIDSGLEEPLNDLVATWQQEDPEGFAKVSPNAFFSNEAGDIVGMTPIANMDVLYMRTDWLAEAGITQLPTSWDGVLEALQAIKDAKPDVLPIALNAARGTAVPWFYSMLGAVGTPFNGSAPDLESEGGLYTIGWLQQAVRNGLTEIESLAWTDDETRGNFIGGSAAMIYDSMRSTNDLGGELINSGVAYGDNGWLTIAAPLRMRDNGEEVGRDLMGTRTYHVTIASEHRYEAGVVLRELFSEQQAYEALEVSNTPLHPAVIKSDAYTEKQPYVTEEERDAILNAAQRPADSHFFEVVEILEQLVQDVYQNPDTPVEEMAAKWQAELDALS